MAQTEAWPHSLETIPPLDLGTALLDTLQWCVKRASMTRDQVREALAKIEPAKIGLAHSSCRSSCGF